MEKDLEECRSLLVELLNQLEIVPTDDGIVVHGEIDVDLWLRITRLRVIHLTDIH